MTVNMQDPRALEQAKLSYTHLPQSDADIYLVNHGWDEKIYDVYVPHEHPMSLPFAVLWEDMEREIVESAKHQKRMHVLRFLQGFADDGYVSMGQP